MNIKKYYDVAIQYKPGPFNKNKSRAYYPFNEETRKLIFKLFRRTIDDKIYIIEK